MKNPYIYDIKDQSPIRFEFYQSDMEKIMYQINQLQKGINNHTQWELIKKDLQRKIDIHRERGEWK